MCNNEYPTPNCTQTCQSNYPKTYSQDKHFGISVYSISNNVGQTEQEIMSNGPVEASFDVYEDFLTYRSGVYRHVSGDYVGGHAIKILGWGVDKTNTPYWICANSWNKYWGNNGYFLILRGHDECGIEEFIVAGISK